MKMLNSLVLTVALSLMFTPSVNAYLTTPNLIINGSFETPDIPQGVSVGPVGGWAFFYSYTPELGWTPITGGLEIQDRIIVSDGVTTLAWQAYTGDQFAELDANYANGGIFQTVNTTPGQVYNLSFAYSPRPGAGANTNIIDLYINGALADSITGSGLGILQTSWSLQSYTFTASGTSSTIKFAAAGTPDGLGGFLDDVQFRAVNELSCVGFESPMDSGPVVVKKNRVLPLKARFVDSNGAFVTGDDIVFPPFIQVIKTNTGVLDPIDVTSNALPVGQGTEGNQFVFTTDGKWQFNLMTKNYSAPGTYTISILTGDSSEYTINPSCIATFLIE